MKRTHTEVPLVVLAQALVIGIIGGIPVLFVAFNQIRRACGDRLFGSREHFCSARELWTWTLSFPDWTYWIVPIVAITGFAIARGFVLKIAS